MVPTDSNNDKPSILKSTREAKGLTLEIVHEATKIPMDALKSIEEGYSSRILSPFYYRGFIKIYAEFLGLDIAEMYKQYGLDQPPKPASVSIPAVKMSRAPVPAGPNLFLEQLQESIAVIFKPKTFKLIFKVIIFLVLLLLIFKMAGCVASHMTKKTKTSKRQTASLYQENKVITHKEESTEEEKPVIPPPIVKHDSVQAQSENDKVEVAVRANKDTWIQVKADDHVVFQMTLSKGSMESWSADNHIQLSGRNIEQLDMEVNGKHIGSLGGGERRIRKVLITKEGLTVKK
jgi:cytoskeletal protein RodZ